MRRAGDAGAALARGSAATGDGGRAPAGVVPKKVEAPAPEWPAGAPALAPDVLDFGGNARITWD